MAIKQNKKHHGHIRAGAGLILAGLLMSIVPAAQARVEQELYSTRHEAVLAARRMGGSTSIVYDKDLGKYVVTLYERPPARHRHRHHH